MRLDMRSIQDIMGSKVTRVTTCPRRNQVDETWRSSLRHLANL